MLTMLLPETMLLMEFCNFVGDIYQRISPHWRESIALAVQRYGLSPKLLYGEMQGDGTEYWPWINADAY